MSEIYEQWVAEMQPIFDGQYDFEELVSLADTVHSQENFTKWVLGDMATVVESRYGEDRFGEFADRIGENKGTLGNRKRLCEFWEPNVRWNLILECQNIRYSHFTSAMRLGKNLGTSDDEQLQIASEFIRECADKDWTPTMAGAEVKTRLGNISEFLKVDDYLAKTVKDGDAVALLITDGDTALLEDDIEYKIVIYKVNNK